MILPNPNLKMNGGADARKVQWNRGDVAPHARAINPAVMKLKNMDIACGSPRGYRAPVAPGLAFISGWG